MTFKKKNANDTSSIVADEVSYASPELGHHYGGCKIKSMSFLSKKLIFNLPILTQKHPTNTLKTSTN
jgi:hypothetical protein